MSQLMFRWCLVCLLLISGALFATLTDWGTVPGPSIGGSSYSLDSFIYSWSLILLNSAAGLAGIVIGLVTDNRPASRRAGIFAAVAIGLFALTMILYGDNLR